MTWFISLAPFLLSLVFFCTTAAEYFWPLQASEPNSWLWKVHQPLFVAVLAPLVLAARVDKASDVRALIFISVAGLVVCIVSVVSLNRTPYFKMRRLVGTNRREVPFLSRAGVLVATGVLVVVGCSVFTVVIGQRAGTQ